MKEYRADIGGLHLLQIAACLLSACISLAAFWFLRRWIVIMWIVIGVFAGVAVIASFLFLPLYFRKLRVFASPAKLTVRAGILFLRERSILLDRVQFVQTITGPFDGMMGLNFIILYVYGGQLTIPFLCRRDRIELTTLLEQKGVFHAS